MPSPDRSVVTWQERPSPAALEGWTLRVGDVGDAYRGSPGSILRVSSPVPTVGIRLMAVPTFAFAIVVGVLLCFTGYAPFGLFGAPTAIAGAVMLARATGQLVRPSPSIDVSVSASSTVIHHAGRRAAALERVAIEHRRVSGGVSEATLIGSDKRDQVLRVGPLEPAEASALAALLAEHLRLIETDDGWVRPVE